MVYQLKGNIVTIKILISFMNSCESIQIDNYEPLGLINTIHTTLRQELFLAIWIQFLIYKIDLLNILKNQDIINFGKCLFLPCHFFLKDFLLIKLIFLKSIFNYAILPMDHQTKLITFLVRVYQLIYLSHWICICNIGFIEKRAL